MLAEIHIQMSMLKVVDHELLIDPPNPPPMGNFVHYDFLKLRYIRSKMTHVGHLAMRALPCKP